MIEDIIMIKILSNPITTTEALLENVLMPIFNPVFSLVHPEKFTTLHDKNICSFEVCVIKKDKYCTQIAQKCFTLISIYFWVRYY